MTDGTNLTSHEEAIIEEACAHGGSTLQGKPVRFTALPPSLLLKARKRVAAAGKDAMEPFRDWLIEYTGVSEATADTYWRYVWNAMVVTGGDPMRQLERTDLSYNTKVLLKAALSRFAAFCGDAELLSSLASHTTARLIKDRRRTKPTKTVRPFTRQEVDALLGAVNEHKGDPRHPWAWPILRIIIKLGLRTRVDACWIERVRAREAIETGALRIWSKREKMRTVPAKGIQEELEMLTGWPFEWEVTADIIAPAAPEKKRAKAAYDKLRASLKYYAKMVGIPAKEMKTHRLRHAAALRLYKETGHNIVAVAQLLGHNSIETTKRYLSSDMTEELDAAIMSAYEEEEDDENDEWE